MIKKSLLMLAMSASTAAYAVCPSPTGGDVCFEEVDSSIIKYASDTSIDANINGDSFQDRVSIDPFNDEVIVELGTDCGGALGLCYAQPYYTGVTDIKGFEVEDLTGNGAAEIVLRTTNDVLRVLKQTEYSDEPGAIYRKGEAKVVSVLGTNGLTVDSYSASSTATYSDVPAALFDGFVGHHPNVDPIKVSDLGTTPYGLSSHANDPNFDPIEGAWTQVMFENPTSINEVELYNSGSTKIGNNNYTLLYSDDGIHFNTHQVSFVMPEKSAISKKLSVGYMNLLRPTPFAKYFRILRNKPGPYSIGFFRTGDILLKGWFQSDSSPLPINACTR